MFSTLCLFGTGSSDIIDSSRRPFRTALAAQLPHRILDARVNRHWFAMPINTYVYGIWYGRGGMTCFGNTCENVNTLIRDSRWPWSSTVIPTHGSPVPHARISGYVMTTFAPLLVFGTGMVVLRPEKKFLCCPFSQLPCPCASKLHSSNQANLLFKGRAHSACP